MVGWCDGLGQSSSAGASYNLDASRAIALTCSCSRCGERLFRHFYSSLCFLSSSPSLCETARHRLKYCLTGPLHQKQPVEVYMKTNLNHFFVYPKCCLFKILY